MEIRFFKIREAYGCFSNFSDHYIIVDGTVYRTTEHYFQSRKFLDEENRNAVIKSSTPFKAAEIGRDRSRPLREDWEDIKLDVMYEALKYKVEQYPDIKAILLSTGNNTIIEESYKDSYWAEGPDKKGLNMLGKLWMKLRDDIVSSENKIGG